MRQPTLLHRLASDLATCLRFFSRLPLPRPPVDDAAAPFDRAIRMLPVGGLLIGGCGAATLALGVAAGLPPLPAVLIAGAVSVAATGGLHEDGLADTADGFGGGDSRDRKLAIMRDSRIGTYGLLAVGFAVALRMAVLDALLEQSGLAACTTAWLAAAAVSRALALMPLAALDPARPDGLARGVGRPAHNALAACTGAALLLGLGLPLLGGLNAAHAIAACAAAVLAATAMTRLAAVQIGGHTGDVAGACQQVAELAFLVPLLVRGSV